MLIYVKFDCKYLNVRELRNLRRVICKDFLHINISKFDCRRKEFIFIYKC